jgi:transcriptional regulator with XRE-family HTH domain
MDIASLRKGLGLTQAEFAERIGTSMGYVGHLETGVRKPSLKLAARIERVTGAKGLIDSVAAEKKAAALADESRAA